MRNQFIIFALSLVMGVNIANAGDNTMASTSFALQITNQPCNTNITYSLNFPNPSEIEIVNTGFDVNDNSHPVSIESESFSNGEVSISTGSCNGSANSYNVSFILHYPSNINAVDAEVNLPMGATITTTVGGQQLTPIAEPTSGLTIPLNSGD